MGGYAAVRAAIELRAHQAIAFAPQVVLEPSERKALHLPPAPYDIPLEGLSALGRAEGFTLSSLVDIANAAATSDHSTTLDVHVGDQSPGDLTEAKLLQQAVSTLPAQLGLSCSVSVRGFPGRPSTSSAEVLSVYTRRSALGSSMLTSAMPFASSHSSVPVRSASGWP